MAERPRIYRTRGVVLKRTDLGEADKILTIYSYSSGKLRAVAKGVRRPSSKLGGHVDEFAYSDMLLARGRDLDVVTQSQTIETFRGMREDLWRTSCGYYLAELVDCFTEDRIENRPLFELLVSTLQRVARGDDLFTIIRFFELHLLEMVGYRPELARCLGCQTEVKPEANYFSPRMGGVVCPDCGRHEATAQPISLGGLKVLRYLQRLEEPPAAGLRLDASTRREVDATLRHYIEQLLEKTLKSNAFLDRLRLEESVIPRSM